MYKGLGIAIVTPMTEKGIDYITTERLIEFWIEEGAAALVPLGTTGENSTVCADDKAEFLKFVIEKVAGRVPVIAGTGSNSTAIAVENIIKAEKAGADGALVVTPYYNKCTPDGLVAHYRSVCGASALPVIAYNVPGRTCVNILPDTAARLAEIDNLKGIKESSGNIEQIMETMRLTAGRLDIYSGDDALTVPVMMMGGTGVISVAGNVVPKLIATMCRLVLDGDYAGATQLQLKILPLIKSLFCEVNPIPVKAAMALIGFDCGSPLLPLTDATEATKARIKRDLQDLGII